MNTWAALTLRIWADGLAAGVELDRLVEKWALWVAALPREGPFDPVGWWLTPAGAWFRASQMRMLRCGPYSPLEEYFAPDPSPWTLSAAPHSTTVTWPAVTTRGTHIEIADSSPWIGLPIDNESFRQLLADATTDWPKPKWHPVPTHLEVAAHEAVRKADPADPWAPYHPGRYA